MITNTVEASLALPVNCDRRQAGQTLHVCVLTLSAAVSRLRVIEDITPKVKVLVAAILRDGNGPTRTKTILIRSYRIMLVSELCLVHTGDNLSPDKSAQQCGRGFTVLIA